VNRARFLYLDGTDEYREVKELVPWLSLEDGHPVDPVTFSGCSTPPQIFVRQRLIYPACWHGPLQSCWVFVDIMKARYRLETIYRERVFK
jgi:hypothetical protein